MCEEEARVVEMRPVEKAAPALPSAVGGGLCDLDRVSGVGDMDVSGIDTVVSGAVSGGLCDIDSVSGGGDTGVSRVNTVVSDDLDNVSGGDIVVRISDMSLSGGGDAVVLVLTGLCVASIRCWQIVSSTCVVLTQWCLVLTSLCVVTPRW